MNITRLFARRRSRAGLYILSGLSALAGAWLTSRTLRARRSKEAADARLDEAIEESFPASDPRAVGSGRASRGAF